MAKRTRPKSAKAPVEADNIFSSIIQLVHDAIIAVDEDQKIILFNQGAEQTFGYQASEVIGQRLDLLLPPQVSDFHAVYVRSFAKDPETARLMGERKEISGRHKNGAIFPAEASIAKVSIGERTFFTAIFRDITEQVRKAEETRLQLTLTRAIAEADNFNSALSIAIQMICEITGWDFGEVWLPARDGLYLEPGKSYYCKGKKLEKFRTVSERFKFESNIGLPGRVLASRKAVWIPDVTTTEDFERAAYAREAGLKAAVGIPILAGKEVVAVMNFFLKEARPEDKNMVTLISTVAAELGMVFARRQTGQKLRESEEAQRMVLNGIDEIVYQVRFSADNPVEGVVEFVSERVQETLGHRPGEFITDPQRWFSLIHPEDIPIVQDQTKKIVASGLPAVREYRIKDINEEYRWLEDRVVLQKDKKSRVTKMFGVARDVTERKRAEEALLSQETRFRALIENGSDAIALISADGKILYESPAVARVLGYAVGERTGRAFFELVHPDDLPGINNRFAQLLRQPGVTIDAQLRYRHKDGSWRWLEAVGQNLLTDPSVQAIVANYRDITERRRVEGRLQESEEHFRTMFEQAAVGIAHVSTEGGWLLVNQRLCDIVGYTRDELLGLTFQDITHLDDLQTDLTYVQQLLTDEIKTYSMEKRYIRKDRSIVWINLTVSLVRETSGEPKYFISVVEDITERKRTEENLRQSEEKYRKLTETLPIGIAVTTPKGETVEANPALVKMSGYDSKEEFLQAPAIIHYLNPEDRSRYIAQLLERGAVLGFEMPLLRKDGSVFWASASSVTQKHPDGSITLVHSVEDISERKRAEVETQLLLALTKAVAEAESFDSALTLALSLVCRHTGWDFGEVWIPSHDGTHLELGSPYYGMESFQSVSKGFEFAPGIGLPGRVWASGKPIWIPDVTLDANFPRTALAAEAGFKAAVGIPILADDIVVAVINFFLREARQEDERMVALVSAVATQLGIAFQRKQTEDALHRSEATLIRAQKVGHIGSWVLDLQHNTLTWSAEVYRIFGMPPGTPLTYETFLACIHPEDREYADRSWQEALVGAPYDIEHRIVVGEEVKWAHERAELQFDAEGAPLNGIGTVQDITERKRAEEALRKKDEHHKAVIESIFKFVPEGVLVLTESLNLLKQNKAFDDILQKYAPRLGYAEQELADEIIQQLRSKILGDENTEIRVPKKSK